jgi:hypothetical protein
VASSVIYPDMPLFLTTWWREQLAARLEEFLEGFEVDAKEPDPELPFPARLLVIRFDGINRTSFATADCSVGLSVLAGTKANPADANDAAMVILALAERLPSVAPGNPVAAINDLSGPVDVFEPQDRARRLITLDLALAGQPF